MTNQMPERVLAIRDFGVTGKISRVYLTTRQHDIEEFIRADLAQKTVTREWFRDLYYKAHREGKNEHLVDDVFDALIKSGVVKVKE